MVERVALELPCGDLYLLTQLEIRMASLAFFVIAYHSIYELYKMIFLHY